MKERPILFSSEMVRALLDGRKTQTRRVIKPKPELLNLSETDGPPYNIPSWCMYVDSPDAKKRASWAEGEEPFWQYCPYGKPGDHLWVRETWHCPRQLGGSFHREKLIFRAGDGIRGNYESVLWTPSIFMPRRFSRITLEVTGVRVERVQEISEADATAEGFEAVETQPWWQGYRDFEGVGLLHQQHRGDKPPEWMIEPHQMSIYDPLAHTAAREFRITWDGLNHKRGYSWDVNPWVWVIEFKQLHTTQKREA